MDSAQLMLMFIFGAAVLIGLGFALGFGFGVRYQTPPPASMSDSAICTICRTLDGAVKAMIDEAGGMRVLQSRTLDKALAINDMELAWKRQELETLALERNLREASARYVTSTRPPPVRPEDPDELRAASFSDSPDE